MTVISIGYAIDALAVTPLRLFLYTSARFDVLDYRFDVRLDRGFFGKFRFETAAFIRLFVSNNSSLLVLRQKLESFSHTYIYTQLTNSQEIITKQHRNFRSHKFRIPRENRLIARKNNERT